MWDVPQTYVLRQYFKVVHVSPVYDTYLNLNVVMIVRAPKMMWHWISNKFRTALAQHRSVDSVMNSRSTMPWCITYSPRYSQLEKYILIYWVKWIMAMTQWLTLLECHQTQLNYWYNFELWLFGNDQPQGSSQPHTQQPSKRSHFGCAFLPPAYSDILVYQTWESWHIYC